MKKNKVYIILIIIICIITVIIVSINKKANEENAKRFAKEYVQVPQKNVFVYETVDKIMEVIQNGTGIIYLGYPECPWCQVYVKYVNEVAKELKIKKILYCNIKDIKTNNEKEYYKIIDLIKEYLPYEVDRENPILYVPNVIFVVDGKIVGNDNTKSLDSETEEPWNEEIVEKLKRRLEENMKKIL